jgi:ribonucleoside-diphosphate reductase alpha chain
MLALRNCNVNTVAPTGTISIIANCSSGIEPLFAVAFMRNQAGSMMPDVNPEFVRIAKRDGWYSAELMERIAKQGTIHLPEVPAAVQAVFHTAHDTTPHYHVMHQCAWQAHIDSAISKTTNFPNEATVEQVRAIYELAYENGAKGVTVYRDGSRDGQVLSTGATKTPAQGGAPAGPSAEEYELVKRALREAQAEVERLQLQATATVGRRVTRERPKKLIGATYEKESPLGRLYVTINHDIQGNPFEVLSNLGKAGGAASADAEAICRLISLALRSDIPIQSVHKQLRGISSDKAVGFGQNAVLSMPDGIAQVIEDHLREAAGVQAELPLLSGRAAAAPLASFTSNDTALLNCTECGSNAVAMEEGCMKCRGCGSSKCGGF